MGNKIKVLHVVVNMNRGGAETFIMNIYRQIDRSMIQFDFLTFNKGDFDSEISTFGGLIHRIPYITEIGPFDFRRQLINFFSEHKEYKIIHSHLDKMSGLVLKCANVSGVPIRIAHSHSTRSEGNYLVRLYKEYVGLYINSNATTFLACSREASRWLYGRNSSISIILRNGIKLSNFKFSEMDRKHIRNELGIDDKTILIGHVGRFSLPKNHQFLIKLIYDLKLQKQNVKLILIGKGKLLSGINEKVVKLNLVDDVIFLGLRADVEKVLCSLDIFVFPSLFEGFPVSLVEAEAVGLYCLVSNRITREICVDSHQTKFLDINETNQWIKEISSYRNQIFPESNNELRKLGYDIKEVCESLESLYNELYQKIPTR